MAEGWARHLLGDAVEPYSAGTVPGRVDPRATRVMAEVGVDLGAHRSKHLDELSDIRFDVVVTVCDRANESCPVFPGSTHRIHAGFDDPPKLAAGESDEERAVAPYRAVRDQIRAFVEGLPARLRDGALTSDAPDGESP